MKRKTKIILNVILLISILFLFVLFLQFLLLIIRDIKMDLEYFGEIPKTTIENHLKYYYPYCIVSLLHIGVDIFMLILFNKKDISILHESILKDRQEKLKDRQEKLKAKKAKEKERLEKRLEELNKE